MAHLQSSLEERQQAMRLRHAASEGRNTMAVLGYAPEEARERMARTRYQDPPLAVWAKNSRPYYGIRVRLDRFTTQGRKIVQTVLNCGYVDEVTKRQAERERARLLAEVNNQALRAPSKIHFGDFVKEIWRPKHYPNLGEGTRRKYEVHLGRHILPALRDYELEDLGPGELQDFFNSLKDLSWNTKADIRNIISCVYRRAREWSWVQGYNPLLGACPSIQNPAGSTTIYCSFEKC